MSNFKNIANQANRDAQLRRIAREKDEIDDKINKLESDIQAAAKEGKFSLEVYEFSADKHWWHDRPKTPDHRWAGMLRMVDKARELGVTAEITAKSPGWLLYDWPDRFKLVLSWD